MDDLQLNISFAKKGKNRPGAPAKNASEYKFVSNPKFTGKTIARKRAQNVSEKKFTPNISEEPQKKVAKLVTNNEPSSNDLATKLRDLSENKGKFHGKNYQELSDKIQLKQKPRPGGWISSLFKNNPGVPRIGQRAVKPIVEKVFAGKNFSDLDIHPHSVANLQQNLGLKELMTVQQNAIPVILQGRDILIRSQTGSGKTLAYALPIIEGLQAIRPKINRHAGIMVVVVVPTRELAVQTYELFVKLVKPFTWIVPGLLSGGQKRKAEKARLRKGLSILVGTPGRINDHLRHTQSLNFAKTGCLVLDEADRLLDMGYEKDVAAIVKALEDHKKAATYDPMALVKQTVIKKISSDDETEKSKNDNAEADNVEEKPQIKHHLTDIFTSKEKQTILLSATLTKAVENLAGITLVNPVFVDTSEGKTLVADSLKPKQSNENIDKTDKALLKKKQESKPVEEKNVETTKTPLAATVDTEVKEESKKGLKAFSGLNHADLFKNDDSKQTVNTNIDTAPTVDDDSDSDSDYEYFKVQKQIEAKNPKDAVVEETEEVIKPPVEDNTFAEALKSAIGEDELVLPATVNQTFLVVPMKLRLVTLCALIVEHCVLNKKGGKMIVFMATLEMVEYHSELIETVLTGKDVKVKKKGQDKVKKSKGKKRKADGSDDDDDEDDSASEASDEYQVEYENPAEGTLVPVELEMFSLHGSMPHERRMEVFKQFRAARNGVLICTDVAARGIDVPRVDLVLQYCVPASATDYVHRVGRTGRAAQVGAAVLFLLPSEAQFIRHLEQKRIRLRQSDESKVLEALRSVAPAAANFTRAAVAVQAKLERIAHSNRDWLLRASRAYTSWVRFYSGYPREVREWLDARQLHLGHAAKAFALRDTPATLARRVKLEPPTKEKPTNRLTIHEDEEKRRPGFPKMKIGFGSRGVNKQVSMHTASEFDSGLPPLDQSQAKKKKKNR